MAGTYLNKQDKYKELLSKWIDDSIKSKSWEKFDDLHLDEIDFEFNKTSYWIEGSFFIYEIILRILNSDSYNCLLAIPLVYANIKTDVSHLTWPNIKLLLDLTPPSFYLFPNGEVNYEETLKDLTFLEKLSINSNYNVFFKEEKEFEGEYNRCIYVVRK